MNLAQHFSAGIIGQKPTDPQSGRLKVNNPRLAQLQPSASRTRIGSHFMPSTKAFHRKTISPLRGLHRFGGLAVKILTDDLPGAIATGPELNVAQAVETRAK